jgi:type II secretory pathway pseudopilin PulG
MRGMTLIETLVALGVFMIVIVAVCSYQVSVYSNNRVISGNLQTAQEAQVILKTLLTELRAAAPAADGSYTIASASTSSISFFADPDNDGQTEKITYTLVGTKLYRAIIQPTGTPPVYNSATQATSSVLTDVRNGTSSPVFQYYDQNYTGTSSPLTMPVSVQSIRLIQISLALDVYINQEPLVRTYTTQVSLRNLKTNL